MYTIRSLTEGSGSLERFSINSNEIFLFIAIHQRTSGSVSLDRNPTTDIGIVLLKATFFLALGKDVTISIHTSSGA